ncbi:hypothetical protein F4779DRAFT_629506 [Xylariaceae sp. FL0662B]|nr:hypothetical protein F4779DRAFT_629506 [Xylariaceae sp. FL0662B]
MQRSKQKTKTSRPWSERKWHDEYKQYYQERIDRHGNLEYRWVGPAQPSTTDQSVPRSDNSIDNLADGVGQLDVNHSSYASAQPFEYESHHTVASHAAGSISMSPNYTLNTHQPQETDYQGQGYIQQQQDKGKGKSHQDLQLEDYNDSPAEVSPHQSVDPNLELGVDSYTAETFVQYGTPSYLDGGATSAGSSANSLESQVNDYESEGASHSVDDVAYQEAIHMSRSSYYGTNEIGESSYSTSSVSQGATSPWPPSVDPSAYDIDATLTAEEDVPTPRGGSPLPPTPIPTILSYPASSYGNYTIQGTPGSEEELDARYRVEHSQRFQPGEVFKILWSEPLGQVGGDDPISDMTTRRTSTGQFYVGVRRFIIVTTDESHHSTCVPILTYDRKGCLKRGVKPNKHGIIYVEGFKKPKPLNNEPRLGFDPVALSIYAEGEKLAKESRVNYSKLVTIEHNVKVFFIGSITGNHFENVRNAVNECWEQKMHRSTRRSRR